MAESDTLTRTDEETSLDVPWNVVVHDDPVNLMNYVTYIFQKLFGYSEPHATELMLQVHNEGRAVVSAGTRESMEVDVSKLEMGDVIDIYPYDGKITQGGAVVTEFQLRSDVLFDEVRAGGRINLIIGRGLTADGLCVTLSGVLGGLPSDTSASNVTFSAASGATARVIGFAAGGYDSYARLVTRHMGRHLPGGKCPPPPARPLGRGLAQLLLNPVRTLRPRTGPCCSSSPASSTSPGRASPSAATVVSGVAWPSTRLPLATPVRLRP